MRRLSTVLPACVAVAIAVLGIAACGSTDTGRAASKVPLGRDADGDNDSLGQGRYDTDNDAILTWGPPADATERRRIVALIKRYYEVAATGDGAQACSMLDPLIVETVEEEEHDSTCAQVISRMFEHRHRELVEDVAAFRVTVVQLKGARALALTDFSPTRLLQVMVHRSHGIWQMDTPLYNGAE